MFTALNSFLERITAKATKKTSEVLTQYRAFVTKLAADKPLSNQEAARLEEIILEMNLTAEDLKTDVAAVQDLEKHKAFAAEWPIERKKELTAENARLMAEVEEMQTRKIPAMRERARAAFGEAQNCDHAQARIREHLAKHPRLFASE